MKLRIRGNSVRFRLSPSDIARLIDAGAVEAHVAFGPAASSRLWYGLEVSADATDVAAAYDGARLRVVLPLHTARHWAQGRDVAIEAEQDVGGGVTGEKLLLSIEKDFECLHRNDREADTDVFPNPAAERAAPGGREQ